MAPYARRTTIRLLHADPAGTIVRRRGQLGAESHLSPPSRDCTASPSLVSSAEARPCGLQQEWRRCFLLDHVAASSTAATVTRALAPASCMGCHHGHYHAVTTPYGALSSSKRPLLTASHICEALCTIRGSVRSAACQVTAHQFSAATLKAARGAARTAAVASRSAGAM